MVQSNLFLEASEEKIKDIKRTSHNLKRLHCTELIGSNSTHSFYHFENPAIVAIKSDIVIFVHVK